MGLQGWPKQIILAGISFVTTDLAPITAILPIETPGLIYVSAPMKTRELKLTGLVINLKSGSFISWEQVLMCVLWAIVVKSPILTLSKLYISASNPIPVLFPISRFHGNHIFAFGSIPEPEPILAPTTLN